MIKLMWHFYKKDIFNVFNWKTFFQFGSKKWVNLCDTFQKVKICYKIAIFDILTL